MAASNDFYEHERGKQIAHGGSSLCGSHKVGCAACCRQMYKYNYIDLIRPLQEPERRLRGTLVHTCQAYHLAPRATIRSDWLFAKSLDEALLEDGRGYPELIEQAKECSAYIIEQGYLADWKPVLVELELSATLAEIDPAGCDGPLAAFNDKVITCKPDVVGRRSGSLRGGDHKVNSQSGQRMASVNPDADVFELSYQLMQNLAIMRTEKNVEILGGYVEGYTIGRIKGKPRFDYRDHDVRESELARQQAPRIIRHAAAFQEQLDRDLKAGEPALRDGMVKRACHDGSWDCDFADLCKATSLDGLNMKLEMLYGPKL